MSKAASETQGPLSRPAQRHDHQVVDDQRRVGASPGDGLEIFFGRDADAGQQILGPDRPARRAVQAAEDAGGAERVHAALVDRGRGPRADAAQHRLVPRGHGVKPARRAGGDLVTRDQFLVAALFHRHGKSVDRRERRPACADLVPPHQPRRVRLPIAVEPDTGQPGIAAGAEKLGKIFGCRRLQIDGRGLSPAAGLANRWSAVGCQRKAIRGTRSPLTSSMRTHATAPANPSTSKPRTPPRKARE